MWYILLFIIILIISIIFLYQSKNKENYWFRKPGWKYRHWRGPGWYGYSPGWCLHKCANKHYGFRAGACGPACRQFLWHSEELPTPLESPWKIDPTETQSLRW